MSVNRNSVKALLNAAEKGSVVKIDNYLKSMPVDSSDDHSHVALHFAAANGHENAVRHLIKKGAKLDCRNWCGWTALMYAAYYGHANVVALLVQNNAKVNYLNDRQASALICAARCGHKLVIEILLDSGAGINPPVADKPSTTSLMAAAQHGHFSIVSLLLQYGVNVDYKNPDTGYTALMLAASNGHSEIVELLIEKGGADPNLINVCNLTAFELSCLRNRTDVQTYLQQRTTKSIPRPPSGEKDKQNLIDAVKSGKFQKVLQLLNNNKFKIDVNVRDAEGATPLIYAAVGGHVEIVRALLKRGADTDVQDNLNGWTALMQATVKSHVEIVKLLLNSGANVTIKSNNGLAVFDLANIAAIPEVTRLVAPGANVTQANSQAEKKNFFSKLGGKMGINKRAQPISRVSVQRKDIVDGSAVGDDLDQEEDSDELKKTSSVLSLYDANRSLGASGTAKARITLPTPQVKLPDDVVAPVMAPYAKLPSFDLPKMPIMNFKLNSSNGSCDESSQLNNSDDGMSGKTFRNFPDAASTHSNTSVRLKRPQLMRNSPVQPYSPQYSPQSSMTSSDITSISQVRGPGIMPEPVFNRQPMELLNRHEFAWGSSAGFPTSSKSPIPPLFGTHPDQNTSASHSPLPLPPLNDLSIQSVRSIDHTVDDIDTFLKRLALEKYTSAFQDEEVDLETLREMNDGDLRVMGIDQTISRDKILEAVKKQKERHSQRHEPSIHSHYDLQMHHQNYQLPVPPSSRHGSVVSAPGHLKLAPLPGFLSSSR